MKWMIIFRLIVQGSKKLREDLVCAREIGLIFGLGRYIGYIVLCERGSTV